jgi:AcrR family transcriptional regulator
MSKSTKSRRVNQRHRTRKDLLAAASRLLKSGRTPEMDDVAREAMVSRATAYRYFPSIESLLIEAPIDGAVPDPNELFRDDPPTDPAERVDRAEAALHDMCYRNEAQLRLMLAASVTRHGSPKAGDGIPVRQNRRAVLIEAALAPVRSHLTPSNYKRLCASLALIFGPEAMIVFEDVLGIDSKAARHIKSWTVRALVQAAISQSRKKGSIG